MFSLQLIESFKTLIRAPVAAAHADMTRRMLLLRIVRMFFARKVWHEVSSFKLIGATACERNQLSSGPQRPKTSWNMLNWVPRLFNSQPNVLITIWLSWFCICKALIFHAFLLLPCLQNEFVKERKTRISLLMRHHAQQLGRSKFCLIFSLQVCELLAWRLVLRSLSWKMPFCLSLGSLQGYIFIAPSSSPPPSGGWSQITEKVPLHFSDI